MNIYIIFVISTIIILLSLLSVLSYKYEIYTVDYIETYKNEEPINIIFSCDKNQFVGLIAVVHSILIHTKQSHRLKFYFLVDKNEKIILENLLENKFNKNKNNDYSIKYIVKELIPNKEINNNIRVINNNNIMNPLNFARFTFQDHFPELNKILYIDADMIVKEQIENLYDKCYIHKTPIYAVCHDTFKKCFDFKDTYKRLQLNGNEPYFNAGIFCTSLNYWKKNNIQRKIINIMKTHKHSKTPLFKYGTQPLLNLAFINNVGKLPRKWNTLNLGNDTSINKNMLDNAAVLHWNGKKKPWLNNGYYKELWEPYNI